MASAVEAAIVTRAQYRPAEPGQAQHAVGAPAASPRLAAPAAPGPVAAARRSSELPETREQFH
eukprot:5074294-Lingulodinium_polyedra.AAC.1